MSAPNRAAVINDTFLLMPVLKTKPVVEDVEESIEEELEEESQA